MIREEAVFEVKLISPEVLARYMAYRGFTVHTLADRVGCSRATIGHLRSGRRGHCRDAWAKKIEKALEAPPGSLFVARVSRVAREAQRPGRAA